MYTIFRRKESLYENFGYRYGWLPPEGLIEKAARRRSLSLDNLEKSITALEIEYGALPEAALMLPLWKQNNTLSPRERELRTHREYLSEKASISSTNCG